MLPVKSFGSLFNWRKSIEKIVKINFFFISISSIVGRKMRTSLIFFISVVLSAGVIANAVVQKRQFYTTVVYISKSNPSMAVSTTISSEKYWMSLISHLHLQVIYFQSLILVLMLGKLMRKVRMSLDCEDLFADWEFFRFSLELYEQPNLSI